MQSLIQHLLTIQPSGIPTIVVIGAGNGGGLPELRKLNSRRMLLVEAHPEQNAVLSRRIEAALGEEILPVAATTAPQARTTLFLCNNPRYSSLHAPRELQTHFPNLAMIGESEVTARPLVDILAGVSTDDQQGKLLILDAPGQSLDLLRSVSEDLLQTFDWIIACTADAPLYVGDDSGACLSTLDAMGFDVVVEDSSVIAPERRVLLQRHDAKIKRARLTAEREKLSGQLAHLERQYEAELARIAAEHQKQSDEHQSRIAALVAERDQDAKLINERNAALDRATAELKKNADDYKAQLAAVTAERDRHAKLAEQHKAEFDKIAAQDRARGARIAHLERENAELSQRHGRLGNEMIRAEAQIELIKDVLLRDAGL